MSRSSYLQDDEDDEDEDFIPGIDEEDGDFSGDDDEESEAGDSISGIPSFLQGYLMVDPTDHRTIVYKENNDENRSFCLKSEGDIPKEWNICSPVLPEPVTFVGWIGHPTMCLEFKVQVVEQDIVDSLDEKLLQAQHEKMKSDPDEKRTKSRATTKTIAKQDQKEPALSAKCPQESTKPPQILKPVPAPPGDEKPVTYCITGTTCHDSQVITFRGVFCPPAFLEGFSSMFVICTTKVETTLEEYGATTAPSGGRGAVAASKRKRDEYDGDNEDDARNVSMQELIELHEDARRCLTHQQK